MIYRTPLLEAFFQLLLIKTMSLIQSRISERPEASHSQVYLTQSNVMDAVQDSVLLMSLLA